MEETSKKQEKTMDDKALTHELIHPRLYTLKKQNQSGNPALSRGREGVFQQVTVLYVKNSGQNDRSFV